MILPSKSGISTLFLVFILGCGLCFGQAPSEPSAPSSQPPAGSAKPPVFVMLKLDDLTRNTPGWIRTVEFLREKKVKSSIGIICNSLEKDNQAYFDWIKGVQDGGLVEFWNHGYDHKEWKEGEIKLQEFKGPAYEMQKEHFAKSQQLAKDKLGLVLRTFGAPFNATDENTLKVMKEDPDVKVFLYGNPKDAAAIPDVMILDRTQMNIENPLFVPNAQRVEHDFNILSKTRDNFVIQGHPNQWDDARFEEFKKLVEFLISKEVVFTTPYEYYLSKTNGGTTPPPAPPLPAAPAPKAPAASGPTPMGDVLRNGGFEEGESGWSLYVPKESSESGAAFELSADRPHSGKQAGKLSSQLAARYCVLQYPRNLSLMPGDRYRLSAWVRAGEDFKPQAGSPGFALRASMFSDEGTTTSAENGLFYVGMKNTAVRGADISPLKGQEIPKEWTKLEAVFEVSPDAAKMNACVFVWSGSGAFFVDDVVLEKVANTTELTPVSGTPKM